MIEDKYIVGKDYDLDEINPMQEGFSKHSGGGQQHDVDVEIPLSEKKITASTAFSQGPKLHLMENSSRLGHMTEHRFLTEAYERGFDIWLPYGCYNRADIALHNGRRFIKVQIKSCHARTGNSNHYKVKLATRAGIYKKEDVDFFAIYIAPTNSWYLISHEDAPLYFCVDPDALNSQSQYLSNWDALKNAI